MKAIQIIEQKLCVKKMRIPKHGKGEVLVKVYYSGVNRIDILQRRGIYPTSASLIPGLEVSGKIVEGDKLYMEKFSLTVGDRVCTLLKCDGYSQYCVTLASLCIKVSDNLSLADAATLPESLFTAWISLNEKARLRFNETLLIDGGSSGGVGLYTMQIAKLFFKSNVISICSSKVKCDFCLRLGSDYSLNYLQENFLEELENIAKKSTPNVVLNMVGENLINREVNIMSKNGRLVLIANRLREKNAISISLMLRKRIDMFCVGLRDTAVNIKNMIKRKLEKNIMILIQTNKIKIVPYRIFDFNEVEQAHRLVEDNQNIGKVLICWK